MSSSKSPAKRNPKALSSCPGISGPWAHKRKEDGRLRNLKIPVYANLAMAERLETFQNLQIKILSAYPVTLAFTEKRPGKRRARQRREAR